MDLYVAMLGTFLSLLFSHHSGMDVEINGDWALFVPCLYLNTCF